MHYTLAHGTGNDFVVLGDLDDALDLSDGLVRALAARRTGLGADGVIRIGGAEDAGAFMDYRNADGSIVGMCGNGVRVTAKYVVDRGLVRPDADGVVRIATRAGVRPVRITAWHDDGRVAEVAVGMGAPEFAPTAVPFDAAGGEADPYTITCAGSATSDGRPAEVSVGVVSMGNPHAVTVVEDVAHADVAGLGAALEGHERFPERVNVGFAERVAPDRLRLRVWERGVGETAACGTGACAAVAVLHRRGQLSDDVAVELPGGVLRITGDDTGLVLTGSAVEIAEGRLDPGWLDAVRDGEKRDDH